MKIDLYHFESCPYCRRVREFIETNDLKSKVVYHDIELDPEAHKALLKINNDDDQVPCLVVDGKPMLESDDIIDWLKKSL